MNREDIEKIIPHREHMLLVDETALTSGVAGQTDSAATGRYTVRGNEFFLRGHFPGNPVVPGAILCEMLVQSSCVLLAPESEGRATYLAGMNKVKFKDKVVPGDTVVLKTTLTARKGPFYFIKGSGHVRDKLCLSGEFSVAVL